MPAPRRLDLPAIERALREVQSRFSELSRHFTEPRDPLTDEVLHNVLEGYALIDSYVASGVDLFDLQQLNLMLEINATVLCGRDPVRRREYAQHLAATEEHFFNKRRGGDKRLVQLVLCVSQRIRLETCSRCLRANPQQAAVVY